MAKYFVWRFSSEYPYRAYGTRNYEQPVINDARCIWRGDSLEEARRMAKKANRLLRNLEIDLKTPEGEP